MSFISLRNYSQILPGFGGSTSITSIYARSGVLTVGEGAAKGLAKEEAVDYRNVNRLDFSENCTIYWWIYVSATNLNGVGEARLGGVRSELYVGVDPMPPATFVFLLIWTASVRAHSWSTPEIPFRLGPSNLYFS